MIGTVAKEVNGNNGSTAKKAITNGKAAPVEVAHNEDDEIDIDDI